MNTCRLYLLDDHKIIRDGIRSILSGVDNYKIAGESGDPETFFEEFHRLGIDILLLDITFPKVTGFQILSAIKKLSPSMKVMILSMHNDPEFMQRCTLLGAHGYLTKDSGSPEFIKALDKIREGGFYFINREVSSVRTKVKSDVLTEREHEVLVLLSNGFSSKQIGGELGISTRTVDVHRLNIMKKLGATNIAETISIAVRLNLL